MFPLLLSGFLIVSCAGKPVFPWPAGKAETAILPPPTSPLSRSVIGFGVISASYTHVVSEPNASGFSLGYLRKSSIVEVLERRSVNNNGVPESWVLVGDSFRGWLREDVIQVYDSEARARTAAESLRP
ncbi:MAG: hypothetical protein LBH57_06365 [Treponema sp.]|nr:hypothetical protein [Treponema sp.]